MNHLGVGIVLFDVVLFVVLFAQTAAVKASIQTGEKLPPTCRYNNIFVTKGPKAALYFCIDGRWVAVSMGTPGAPGARGPAGLTGAAGAPGVTMFDGIGDFQTVLSNNALTVNGRCSVERPCNIEYSGDPRFAAIVYQFTTSASISAPVGSGYVGIYFDGLSHSLGAYCDGVTAKCTGLFCVPGTQFPVQSIALYTWQVVNGKFTTGRSWRAALSRRDSLAVVEDR